MAGAMTYPIFAAAIGLLLAALILFLLRRDQLYLRDATFWLGTAMVSIAFALFPSLVDLLGGMAGVAYPPALILAVVCVVLTVKALLADIAQTQLRRDVRRLNQRVALMDADRQSDRVFEINKQEV
jgi:hypothetical protein